MPSRRSYNNNLLLSYRELIKLFAGKRFSDCCCLRFVIRELERGVAWHHHSDEEAGLWEDHSVTQF